VEAGSDRLTYAQLGDRSSRLAMRLRQLGVGAEEVVALHLPRGAELVVSMLGALRAGAAYLPLDPGTPAARVEYMLAAASARRMIVSGPTTIAPAGLDLLDLLDVARASLEAAPGGDGSARPPDVRADQLAYVIFTSGSSGRPKPVAITHRALVNHAAGMIERYGLGPGDRVLQFANPAFDVMAEEVFPTLAAGATVVTMAGPTPTPAELEEFCAAERITVANLPSPYWNDWVRGLREEPRPLPPSLRLLVVGSDVAHASTLAEWRRHSAVAVVNAYGLTEATITCTTQTFAGSDSPAADVLPVGRPIPGVEAYVLDAELRPVAAGDAGELFLGGLALARGYAGQPALTASRFLPDAVGGTAGGRLCRTGDRARLLADGGLELLGRLDDQVKVLGQRVEPGEVAAALRRLPELADAYVTATPARAGTERRLIAYVVPHSGAVPPSPAELRRALAAELPAAMIPSAWLTLDTLPLGPNGKVDRRALPEPPAPGAAHRPPSTATEERIARIWRDLLGLDVVGVDDNFFDLGGHSLLLAQVRRRLARELARELSGLLLFQRPTIGSLARHLDGRDEERPAGPEHRGEARHRGHSRLQRLRALRTDPGGER
jgi:amino acid adenylation domain-containing protein